MKSMTADDIQSAYAEGLAFQKKGDAGAALRVYRGIVAANPRIAEAHYQIGRILTGTYQTAAALPHLKEAVRLRPKEAAVWLAWADAVSLGDNAADEKELLRALSTAQVDAGLRLRIQDRFGAHRVKGRAQTGGVRQTDIVALLTLVEAGRAAEAEARAMVVLRQHPQSALVLNILGIAQGQQKRSVEAVTNLRKALQIDPDYAEGHNNLGRILVDMKQADAAEQHFRQAVTLAPGMPSALVNLATSLNHTGRSAVAIRFLDRALAADNSMLSVHLALGNTHTRLKNYAKAEAAFAKAVQLQESQARAGKAPAANEALGLLAQAQARIGKDELALAGFEKAVAADPQSPVATAGLAALLQTLGRFDEAEVMFRKAFAADPLNGENYRLFVTSQKIKADDPILPEMLALYEQPGLKTGSKAAFGFAIAKSLEDSKAYDRVFQYLNQANALTRAEFPYDIATRYAEVEATKKAFEGYDWSDPQFAEANHSAPIFISGMPRSGTTLVEQIISSHSAVTGAGELGEGAREASRIIFDPAYAMGLSKIPQTVIEGLGRTYESTIRARFPGSERISDKSIQTYMYLGLMKLALPQARFIFVRRDPRDTLMSIYKNRFPEDTHLYAYDQRDLARYYATFVDMIDFWRERVPDWFYEVEYESLVADPEQETRKLIAACGLEWEDACLRPQDNTRKVETLSVFQARQPISGGSVKGWKRHEKDLAPMLDELRKLGLVSD